TATEPNSQRGTSTRRSWSSSDSVQHPIFGCTCVEAEVHERWILVEGIGGLRTLDGRGAACMEETASWDADEKEVYGPRLCGLNVRRRLLKRKDPDLDNSQKANFLAFDVVSSFSFSKSFDFTTRGYDHLKLISTMDKRGEVMSALATLPAW